MLLGLNCVCARGEGFVRQLCSPATPVQHPAFPGCFSHSRLPGHSQERCNKGGRRRCYDCMCVCVCVCVYIYMNVWVVCMGVCGMCARVFMGYGCVWEKVSGRQPTNPTMLPRTSKAVLITNSMRGGELSADTSWRIVPLSKASCRQPRSQYLHAHIGGKEQ